MAGSPRGTVEFFAAYDAVLARWPVPVDPVDVPSAYGTTRVKCVRAGRRRSAGAAARRRRHLHRLVCHRPRGSLGRTGGTRSINSATRAAGLRLTYRLRAVPLLVRPTAPRMRAFLDWETGGARLDPGWRELMALGAGFRKSKVVLPRRPDTGRLRGLAVPTLVLLAEHGKAHDVHRVAGTASALLPHVTTSVLPAATPHTIPTEGAAELERQLLVYLAANPRP